ncbi:MAG: helix-turn-helix domain-containing protein [Lachnospiraceae bacterium]|nr:helix-turn-helix domain-containing protein [Lachnospiraceae bacterium]
MSYKLRFTVPEIERIKKYANLEEREEILLDLKNGKRVPSVEEIAEIMDMSVSTVSRTTKELNRKIKKVL